MSIKLIVLDVDVTLTNGEITFTESGDEVKSFCVKDGLHIVSWTRLGRDVAIITGRESKIVSRRAKELGIKHLYQGVKDKREVLQNILDELDLSMENVASIGDDLNDYSMLVSSKISFVPANASNYVKKIADIILSQNGGDGAVREMIERLIISEGLEDKYLKLWY